MSQFPALQLVHITNAIENVEKVALKRDDWDAAAKLGVANALTAVLGDMLAIGLGELAFVAEQFATQIQSCDRTAAMNRGIGLRHQLDGALRARCFIHLPTKWADRYDMEAPCGEEVRLRFKMANLEMTYSIKCLAFGFSMASTFHSMRAVELVLFALAARLRVKLPTERDRSWGKVLPRISDNLKARDHGTSPYPKPSKKWVKDSKVFWDIHGDLVAIKNAWRNDTMHVSIRYNDTEAETIYNATETLLMGAAKQLLEGRQSGE